MRHATVLCLLVLTLTTAPSWVSAEDVIDDSKAEPRYLLVLSATSGTLQGDTLTLDGVTSVIYFSDHPARKAGHMPLSHLLATWNSDGFQADPPNATLSVLAENGERDTVLELLSAELADGSLRFKVKVLEGDLKGPFETAALFVDDAKAVCKEIT